LRLIPERTAPQSDGLNEDSNVEAARYCRVRLVPHRSFGSTLGFGIFGDLTNLGAVALGLILKFPDDGGQSLDKDE
jgi:hypothetical protein